jgi:hypothetical protein
MLESSNGQSTFIASFDSAGALRWARALETATTGPGPFAITTDGEGQIYVAIGFSGSVNVGSEDKPKLLTSRGASDILLGSYGTDGQLSWATSIGGPDADVPGPGGLAMDPAGNLILTGTFSGAADFDSGPAEATLRSAGAGDAFVAKYGTDGTYQWAIALGDRGLDGGHKLTVDSEGTIYVTGWFNGTTSVGNGDTCAPLTSQASDGATDIFLIALSPGGACRWAIAIGGRNSGRQQLSIGGAVAVGPDGDLFLTGRFFGSEVNFNPLGPSALLSSAGEADAFLARYSLDGKLRFSRR